MTTLLADLKRDVERIERLPGSRAGEGVLEARRLTVDDTRKIIGLVEAGLLDNEEMKRFDEIVRLHSLVVPDYERQGGNPLGDAAWLLLRMQRIQVALRPFVRERF